MLNYTSRGLLLPRNLDSQPLYGCPLGERSAVLCGTPAKELVCCVLKLQRHLVRLEERPWRRMVRVWIRHDLPRGGHPLPGGETI